VLVESKKVEEMNYFELLAWLGIGSSHPGGFRATQQNLDYMQVKSEEYVLDAGCGSGLTACHLAKTIGCKIIGVDINPQMIEKACLRAEKEGVSHLVEFRLADVNNLPFADNHFDLVIAESILVFLDKVKVYQEFYRVLKPEGRVADLEMVLLAELPANLRMQMEACFGSGTNPLPVEEWLNALTQAGFQDVVIKNPQRMKNNGNVILNELKGLGSNKGSYGKSCQLPWLNYQIAEKCRFYEEKPRLFWIWSYLWAKTNSPSVSRESWFQRLGTAGITLEVKHIR